jgi:adenylate kinase family enzyme
MESFPFKRVVVIGSTSSGKSTLAKRLADRFALNFVELDSLHWEPNWHEASDEVFRARVAEATRAERWVVAGNYLRVRDIVWPRAEAVIWLDYSFPRVFWQLTVRTFRRGVLQEELWNGNREKLWWHFKLWSDESLYHWLFKTYWKHKREYPLLFAQPENAHLKVIQLKSPKETEEWLKSLASLQHRLRNQPIN